MEGEPFWNGNVRGNWNSRAGDKEKYFSQIRNPFREMVGDEKAPLGGQKFYYYGLKSWTATNQVPQGAREESSCI